MSITVISEVLEFNQFVNNWGDRSDAAGIKVNAEATGGMHGEYW